jgi:hypothetical protein
MDEQRLDYEFLDAEADGYVAGVMFGRWARGLLGDDAGNFVLGALLRSYPDPGSAPAPLIAFLKGVVQGADDQRDEDGDPPFTVEFHRFVDAETLA